MAHFLSNTVRSQSKINRSNVFWPTRTQQVKKSKDPWCTVPVPAKKIPDKTWGTSATLSSGTREGRKIRQKLGHPQRRESAKTWGKKSANKLNYRQGSAWEGSRWRRADRPPPGRSQSSTRSPPGRRRPAHPPHGCLAGRWAGSRPPSGYPRKKEEFELP